MGIQLVWLKRDLRLRDHAALSGALEAGPVVGLYLFEDAWLGHPECDGAQVAFVRDALAELREAWRRRGGLLLVRRGEIVEVLERVREKIGFEALWSHQETGSLWSYDRDRAVRAWCERTGIAWREPWQNGVIRRLASRDGWSRRWEARMKQPLLPAPERIVSPGLPVDPGPLPSPSALGFPNPRSEIQRAGETEARRTLDTFLEHRGVNYRADMATPVAGWEGCSRLSPHLAWGTLSVRTAFQASVRRSAELKEVRARGEEVPGTWLPSLSSFRSRLSWHCHFLQKLEDQPDLERVPMNRAYEGFNDETASEERLRAFAEGRTGYPMVDACIRCLRTTGWINFRMRAMLTSFGVHHLQQPWREIGAILAPLFLDFEPGIHYSQIQMQAGVTGINAPRIYSPIKQAKDQDPEGVFLRRWLPELEGVPVKDLPEPHRMERTAQLAAGCRIGEDYPPPIVHHKTAYREARQRLFARRRSEEARQEARKVYEKHGSRKRPARARRS